MCFISILLLMVGVQVGGGESYVESTADSPCWQMCTQTGMKISEGACWLVWWAFYRAKRIFCSCIWNIGLNCVKVFVALWFFSFSVKLQTNFHRHNYSESEPENKPVQTGTAVFIKELKSRHFPRFVSFNFSLTREV